MKRGHLLLKIVLTPMAFFCLLQINVGQDLIFSQYYNSPLHINPSFAGIVNYPNFTANYRQQWPSLARAYETFAFTYDQNFNKANSSIGFIATSDNQGNGTLKTTKVAGIYAYNLKFKGDWQIRFGVEVGAIQNRLDWDKLTFLDQIDIETGFVDGSGNPFPTTEIRPNSLANSYLDVGFGMLLYTPDFYAGISLDHVNGPLNGFLQDLDDGTQSPVPLLFSLNAGTQIVLKRDNKKKPTTFISPNVIFALQSNFSQINFGAYVQKDQIFGGAWVRHTINNIDALIFSFGVNLNNIKIGYSFDLTLSNLGVQTGGSHEVGISIGLKHLEKKESKLNDCFSLFR